MWQHFLKDFSGGALFSIFAAVVLALRRIRQIRGRIGGDITLSKEQLDFYVEHGYLVVPDVLSERDVKAATRGLQETLQKFAGVDLDDLQGTAGGLATLSSTKGLGGVLDLFYMPWKLQVQCHPRLVQAIQQLWAATYATAEGLWEHPHGRFDAGRGFVYIDRLCVRVPTELSDSFGGGSGGRRKGRGLQRPLHPHLDCCPHRLYDPPGNPHKPQTSADVASKWRPIQCLVALTDAEERHSGGFECAPGYHRGFDAWARKRNRRWDPALPDKEYASCLGDFTPLTAANQIDRETLEDFRYIPCRKGSAVFWDWRLPHASEKLNRRDYARCAVYCGFLPHVPVNEGYAREQRALLERRQPPTDFWTLCTEPKEKEEPDAELSELAKRLLCYQAW